MKVNNKQPMSRQQQKSIETKNLILFAAKNIKKKQIKDAQNIHKNKDMTHSPSRISARKQVYPTEVFIIILRQKMTCFHII